MTQAKRVHSTPRKPAPKIKVDKPVEGEEVGAREKCRAQAYLLMEPVICDINNMATLAYDAVMNWDGASASKDDPTNSLAHFAVFHLVDMIHDLQKRYRDDDFDRSEKEVA
jgi:hypothetical protein